MPFIIPIPQLSTSYFRKDKQHMRPPINAWIFKVCANPAGALYGNPTPLQGKAAWHTPTLSPAGNALKQRSVVESKTHVVSGH